MVSLDALFQQLAAVDPPRAHEALQALREKIWQAGEHPFQRAEAAAALASQLSAGHPPLVVGHLCDLLSLVAGAAEVPALKRLLKDAAHAQAACFALERVQCAAAAAALADALSEPHTTELRIAIVNALGRKKDSRFKNRLLDLLRDRQLEVRLAAADALAHYPAAELYPRFMVVDTDGRERARRRLADASLRLAETLLCDKQRSSAKKIYEVIAKHNDDKPAARAASLALQELG